MNKNNFLKFLAHLYLGSELFTIWKTLAEAPQFLLRRAVYIKHPSHLPIPLKQKKGLSRGLPVQRDRSASAIRYAKSPARVSLGDISTRNESEQQHRDSERAPLRDAHCSLVSLRYISKRANERNATRYISARNTRPLLANVYISPAYIPA